MDAGKGVPDTGINPLASFLLFFLLQNGGPVPTENLRTILTSVCLGCLTLERKVAWLRHISGVCLIILVALFLATAGVIPHQHPLYDFFSGPAIPVALALMILSLDLKEVARMPRSLVIIYCVGVFATVASTLFAAWIVAPGMGANAALLAAQFGASYIGGGENAVAMQKVFSIPNELFVAGFAVDNLLTSVWMIVTIYLATPVSEDANNTDASTTPPSRLLEEAQVSLVDIFICLACALGSHQFSVYLAATFGVLHPILYLSLVAFGLGQIPYVKARTGPAYLLGSMLFAAFFFSIGAISDLRVLANLPWQVIAMPGIVVFGHGAIIYSMGYLLKTPRNETSLASQSLIGGPSTAVALSQSRGWKNGVSLGLVCGVLGYAIANYFGVGIYYLATKIIHGLG